ncbi:G patch domain-containing protein-like protein [Hapsidospora chrysogenum ATCC 11550]|uniref:G patch domain-containing protein-like protein n=1 Tax=Hapsidospora chrysogenum (strain ATCC 11550 / CBS 779.69 / DSM 880 / IAM 14645 / JCM 23072 / IMI 49137) TaxID=857340 RepID=A0A086TET9_HAPC1|nr:G patch domain-containing protein-like protein [Hapsidospora chrysogenum ATCC 11550]
MSYPQANGASAPDQGEEEDDYMNMTFEDPTPAKETSLQRTQRLKKESRQRGLVKSKAQLAEEEAAAREKALSTSMLDDSRAKKSKGFAMMAKMGFSGGSLGKKAEDGGGQGRTEPIKVDIKEDRAGIGLESDKKRKLREAAEAHGIKAAKLDPDEYRERVRKEREDARLEKQFHAAQRMAERLDDEEAAAAAVTEPTATATSQSGKTKGYDGISSRPLKAIPVLYRGLLRHRAEQERDRRMRHDLEQSLSRLPTYEDDDEDEDGKKALGKTQSTYAAIEDLDEEDDELDEFNALEISERLRQALEYLRARHQYCFWCKAAYPDSEMEGCPGLTEDEHD